MYRLGACLLLLFPVCVFAKTPAEVFSMASPSVVVVRARDAQGKLIGFGSGVVIAPAQVITNCHVTNKGARLEVKSGPGTLPASLRYTDRERDLCQLAVPGLTAPAVKIGSVKQLKIGARVVALGAPQGLELSLSDGIVSALRGAGDASIIQTTAPISPGSSGGGLFDEEGRLIGITTYYLAEGQNLNFALPADWIAALPERAKTAKATGNNQSARLLKAIALEAKKDWNILLAHARAWTIANPRSGLAWLFLGFAFGETGQTEQAIKAYREVLRIDPKFAGAWYNLGVVYGKSGQADQEINAYREALRINPEDAKAWNNLGFAFGKADQTDQAIKAFRETLRINPEDADAWYNLGVVYVKAGQTDQAIKAFREALRINPEYADAWNNLGVVYVKAGQTDQAIKAFREALRINPEYADAWNNLGVVYVKAGQTDQAIKAFREALRINPEYADAWNNLGVVYVKAGQTDQAIKAFREALRINPEDADAWYNLGVVYGRKGERTQVLEVYRQLRALNPVLADKFFNKVVMPR